MRRVVSCFVGMQAFHRVKLCRHLAFELWRHAIDETLDLVETILAWTKMKRAALLVSGWF